MRCNTCGTELPSDTDICPSCGKSVSASIYSEYSAEEAIIPYISYSPVQQQEQLVATGAPLVKTDIALLLPSSQQPPHFDSKHHETPLPGRVSKFTIVLFIILLLLVSASGAGISSYAIFFHSIQLNAQATAVAENLFKTQAQETTTASSSLPQNVYYRLISTPPNFTDPLNGKSSSIWETKEIGSSGCSFSNEGYHVRNNPQHKFTYCSEIGAQFDNFLFQVSMTFIQGIDAGITFRASDQTGSHAYYFSTTNKGIYSLFTVEGNGGGVLAYGRSPVFNGLNHANLLAVMAKGNIIYLFINRHFVAAVNDATYSQGELGFLVGNFIGTQTDVIFTNADIWNL